MDESIHEERYAKETLERYSGSPAAAFQPNLLLTNFPRYVDHFAEMHRVETFEGGMFKVAHAPDEKISILDFKIGSPAAALVVDLCSFLNPQGALLLGMCGGLRRRYQVGDYLVPIASIRAEGTSNFYFPSEVPSLSNFLMLRAIIETMEKEGKKHHLGITYTTNLRFWEYNERFVETLKATRAQAIELECATLFTGSYKRKLTLGALLLVSDLPLYRDQVKTKKSAEEVFKVHMPDHIAMGIRILKHAQVMQSERKKGAYRKDGVDSE